MNPDMKIDHHREFHQSHQNMQILSWACEELWQQEFRISPHADNHRISRLPLSILRMASARISEIRSLAGEKEVATS